MLSRGVFNVNDCYERQGVALKAISYGDITMAGMCAQVATLRSAVRLEQEQQFLIAKKLQELTGSKNIKLKPVIDESLIAGFIVEYGSSQIDLSVKGQLDKITMELTNSPQLAAV
jgi:ATP synthase F1 delta subunit